MSAPRCTICGCTDDRACPGGCGWWRTDPPICTECVKRATITKTAVRRWLRAVTMILHASPWKKPT